MTSFLLGRTPEGKIVIDALNPYAEGGGIAELGDSSSTEGTRKRLPGARLVEAFNTIWSQLTGSGARALVEAGA